MVGEWREIGERMECDETSAGRVIRARDDGTRVATVRVLSNAEWAWGERDGGEQGDCAGRGTGFEGRRTKSCL